MTELYSMKDVARIFAVPESRLRYWMQVGFVGPTVRKGGRFYYTFVDLVAVKSAKDLLAAGVSLARVRKNLDSLRRSLPSDASPLRQLRVCSDGETIVALEGDMAYEPKTGQLVMAFQLPELARRISEALNQAGPATNDAAIPLTVAVDATEANDQCTPLRLFAEACRADEVGEWVLAEHLYRQTLELDPGLAAALTNLGNLVYRKGDLSEARGLYARAVQIDPAQPEARYNLANVLDDAGEHELAVAELRRVCVQAPEFPDAHYNLGLLLQRMGGKQQARECFLRYLQLDAAGEWAERARTFAVSAA